MANLRDKKYVIHYVNLKRYLARGLKLKKIHRAIRFDQAPRLAAYIDKNTIRRAKATADFEKNFFKMMNNAVFDKTMENIRKRVALRLFNKEEMAWKCVCETQL